jgi:hypothetical protein
MADLGNIQDLKDSIDDKIYDNNTFDVSAEDIRSSFEDTVDTLDGLKEGTPTLQQVIDVGSTADSTTDVEVIKDSNSLFVGRDSGTNEPKVGIYHNRGDADSSGNVGVAELNSFGAFQYLGQNSLGEGQIWHSGHTQFFLTGQNSDVSRDVSVEGLAGQYFTAQGNEYTDDEDFYFGARNNGFGFRSREGSDRITLEGNTSAKGVVITEADYGVETPGATLDVDGTLKVRQLAESTSVDLPPFILVPSSTNIVEKKRVKYTNYSESPSGSIDISFTTYNRATYDNLSQNLTFTLSDIPSATYSEEMDGTPFHLKIRDDGTARTLTFPNSVSGASFLPSITGGDSLWMYIELRWSHSDQAWACHELKAEF